MFKRVKRDVVRVLTAEAKFEAKKRKPKVELIGGEDYEHMISDIIDSLYQAGSGTVGARSSVQALTLFVKAQKAILTKLENDARSEAGYRRGRDLDLGLGQ